jgi:hypothetical protein
VTDPRPTRGGEPKSWWRTLVALFAFLLWAHPSLVGLPYATLLLVAPGRRTAWTHALAGFVGTLSVALLVLTSSGSRLGAVTSTFVVTMTAAFVMVALLRPARLLRMALTAIAGALLSTALLMRIVWGPGAWGALVWEATRDASSTMRVIVSLAPGTFGAYEPAVRLVSLTWPAVLTLQALAGLALAWHLYRRAVPAGAEIATQDAVDRTAPIQPEELVRWKSS